MSKRTRRPPDQLLRPLPPGAADLINEARGLVKAGLSFVAAAKLTCGIFAPATIAALVADPVAVCRAHGYRSNGVTAKVLPVPSPAEIAAEKARYHAEHAARVEAARLRRFAEQDPDAPERWFVISCHRRYHHASKKGSRWHRPHQWD